MNRKTPGGADEGGAVDAGNVVARLVTGTDVSGLHAARDLVLEAGQRARAAPAIRHAADLLADLALQIPGPPDPAETGAGLVRLRAIILRRDLPLNALEGKSRFDHLLPVRRPHCGNRGEFAGQRSAGVLNPRPYVDHLGIAQRPKADPDDLDAGPLRAQKIDVAIAGDGHEDRKSTRL